MNRVLRRTTVRSVVVSSAAFLAFAAGAALVQGAAHENIVLKDYDGTIIFLDANNKGTAYSVKGTCFGAAGCHGDANAIDPTVRLGYDEIERHSYHAVNGSNELRGFNNWNPDGLLPDGSADAFRRGVSPQGKNWVQGPGHVGNW